MTIPNLNHQTLLVVFCLLFTGLLGISSCKKDPIPEPSNLGCRTIDFGDRWYWSEDDAGCKCNTDEGYISLYGGQICASVEELDKHTWKEITFIDPIPNALFETMLFGSPAEFYDSISNGNIVVPFGGEQPEFIGPREGRDQSREEKRPSPMDPYWCVGNPNHTNLPSRAFIGAATGVYLEPYDITLTNVDSFRFGTLFCDVNADCRAEPGIATGFIRNDTMYGSMSIIDWLDDSGPRPYPVDTFRFIGVPWGKPYRNH